MSGDLCIDPHDIPHFCYSEDVTHDATLGEEFDEIEGLFGGFLIARVGVCCMSYSSTDYWIWQGLRHIFTGPWLAVNPFHHPPKSKSKGWGLDEITPEMVAYTCVQVFLSFFINIHCYTDTLKLYVALSSMKEWDTIHNNFDLTMFYDHMVRIMKDNSDDEWYRDLMLSLTR